MLHNPIGSGTGQSEWQGKRGAAAAPTPRPRPGISLQGSLSPSGGNSQTPFPDEGVRPSPGPSVHTSHASGGEGPRRLTAAGTSRRRPGVGTRSVHLSEPGLREHPTPRKQNQGAAASTTQTDVHTGQRALALGLPGPVGSSHREAGTAGAERPQVPLETPRALLGPPPPWAPWGRVGRHTGEDKGHVPKPLSPSKRFLPQVPPKYRAQIPLQPFSSSSAPRRTITQAWGSPGGLL